ncbi:MAG: tetratricopeptide repeat protein [Syntrophobacteraceae bacterium]
MTKFKSLLFIAVLVGFAALAHAGFDDGKAALDRGDYAKAYKELQVAADQGNANAQFLLGAMYYDGQGAPQDYVEAVKWARKAAEQGFVPAQCALGAAYHEGQGVPQDDAEAVKWWRKAAEHGETEAQCNLGMMYHGRAQRLRRGIEVVKQGGRARNCYCAR